MEEIREISHPKKSRETFERTPKELFQKRIWEVQKKILKFLYDFFLLTKLKSMPKKTEPKIYKIRKSVINEDPNNLVVRFKNLSKKQLREFKQDLNEFCQAYFQVSIAEEKSEY